MPPLEDLVDRGRLRGFLTDELGPVERFTVERHD
jgi:hypothetical protein